jgi:gallate decarboxylase subunit D
MENFEVEISKGSFKIHGFVQTIGNDILVSIWGGTKPHIGAVGIAIPRPSLKNLKRWSASSSNFTLLNHKEDYLVKKISEKLSAGLKTNVVVTAGLHWDNLTSEEIHAVQKLSLKISGVILKRFNVREKDS